MRRFIISYGTFVNFLLKGSERPKDEENSPAKLEIGRFPKIVGRLSEDLGALHQPGS